ncbi:MAG: GGDEF domain-containing protein [Gammaproteobacteria bacterium]|nr:GGDEF domain-containing protein [Gammaproteobacteria bacterium]
MADPASDNWKQKYLRSLDKLEQREENWNEESALLRRAIGRLVHASYGIAPQLDRRLEQVRAAIKSQESAATLERLARDASEMAIEAQESLQQPREAIGRELARVATTPLLDRSQAKRATKQLAALGKCETPSAFLSLLPELLQLIGNSPATAEATTDASPTLESRPQPESGRGLLGRLFSVSAERTQQRTADGDVDLEWVFSALLRTLEERQVLAEQLASIKTQVTSCQDKEAAKQLLERIVELLAEEHPSASLGVEKNVSSPYPANDALRELLQRLQIPSPHMGALDEIKQLLSTADSKPQIELVSAKIVALLEAIQADVLQEKRELEHFLEGVTSRIQGMTESLLDLESLNQSSDQSLRHLHQGFQSRIRQIRGDIDSETDQQRLKLALERSLDAMEEYMGAYVDEEERNSRDALQQIEDLSSRLHDMKNEAFLLQQQMADERRQAQLDPLTGILNRLAFDERINSEIQRSKRYQEPFSLLVVDIDFFKKINDSFGHLAGDKVLKALAKRLRKSTRDVDLVARYGGEEFVILLPNTGLEAARLVAEKIREIVERAGFHHNGQPVAVTISGGIAEFAPQDNAESLFKRADDALYAAKKAGRNRITAEESELQTA